MKKIILPLLLLVIHTPCAWSAKGDIVMYLGGEKIPYEHVGIDDGEGYIIEFNRINDGVPTILRTPLEDFIKSSPTGKITYIDQQEFERRFPDKKDKLLDPDTVVTTALHYVGQNGTHTGLYDPMTNNCQHFVMLCKIGEPFSWQAESIQQAVGILEANNVLAYSMQQGRNLYNMLLGYINKDWYKIIDNAVELGNESSAYISALLGYLYGSNCFTSFMHGGS